MRNVENNEENAGFENKPDTYFAKAYRSDTNELAKQYEQINVNTILDELLKLEPGLLAILNENRQILTVNKTLLSSFGVESIDEILGLRPGEFFKCQYSNMMSAGCGTSQFCSSCGAAIAIVNSLNESKVSEKECVITTIRNGQKVDIFLTVKATPFCINGYSFVLLFLKDNTIEKQRAGLERVFLHDIIDLVSALNSTTDIIDKVDIDENPQLLDMLKNISNKLKQEFEIQRSLIQSDYFGLSANFAKTSVYKILEEISVIYENHPLSIGKNFSIKIPENDLEIVTDSFLLIKAANNVIVNALEACPEGESVDLSVDYECDSVRFNIANPGVIPIAIAGRIFNRNFTTKEGTGRGIGTYTSKLLIEKYLLGSLRFTTSKESGTVFTIKVPVVSK